jgi:glycosyltransferase involved in cell wall biosynthesis
MKIGFYAYKLPGDDPVARGFLTTQVNLYYGLKHAGVELIDIGPANQHKRHLRKTGIDQILHFCPPHRFDPSGLEWAQNLLFTMWEAPVLPSRVIGQQSGKGFDITSNVEKADAIMVPSQFVQKTFLGSGIDSEVNPLGVAPFFCDLDTSRKMLTGPGCERLRVLFVGANNPRKGHGLLAPAWNKAFGGALSGTVNDKLGVDIAKTVQLYVKILADPKKQSIEDPYGDGRVIIDTRHMGHEDLAKLYGTADIFLFPSLGEGFGLPPLEAMAAGCLVCSTDVGGLSEFVRESTAVVIPRPQKQIMRYGMEWEQNIPTVDSVAACLKAIVHQWGSPAAEAIRKNGTSTARTYTWESTTRRLISWIERKRDHGETMLRRGLEDRRAPAFILGATH